MAQGQAAKTGTKTGIITRREGREGNRWYNQRPDGAALAEWFSSSVPLHEGMTHDPYVGGVILIPNSERSEEVVGFKANNELIRESRTDLVYVPYVKVETKVAYFWDLMRKDKTIGSIEPASIPPMGEQMLHAPPGFFLFDVQRGSTITRYVGYSAQVKVYEREGVKIENGRIVGGTPVSLSPPGTRIVSVLDRSGPDANSMMKAETGAIGRALTLAGILVIPGSGVASAEDIHDLAAGTSATPVPPGGMPGGIAAAAPGQILTDGQVPQGASSYSDQAKALWETVKASPAAQVMVSEFSTWSKAQGAVNMAAVLADEKLSKLATKKLESILDRMGTPPASAGEDSSPF